MMINIPTIHYNSFKKEILAVSDEVPEQIAINCIRLACIDFCNLTKILKRTGEENIYNGLEEYPLNIDKNNIVLDYIDYIRVNNNNIQVINETTALNYNSYCYVGKYRDSIIIKPTPNYCLPCGLKYKITIQPSPNSNSIDEEIYLNYYKTIIDGALANLYIMPRKWYNLNLYNYHINSFKEKIKIFGLNKDKGFSEQILSIRGMELG